MQNVCPITDKRIDENVARVNALLTVLFILAFLIFAFWPGIIFLLVDFAIRGFIDGRYSLMTRFSRIIVAGFNWTPKPMNAGPKIFAAQIGLVFTIIIAAGIALGCSLLCIVVAGMLGLFSFLEFAFGFCVACKVYPFFRRF
jgi:hypothetical protein